ncbi:unnamed protein product [Lactuca virosa]|uniref:Uncharacterized protein n=1 Tax=Lactuca virosa TaxID=75947 RepID=A0AAU9NEF0_9ASTR|nr:unnamed protein product [Lactuca virosa]
MIKTGIIFLNVCDMRKCVFCGEETMVALVKFGAYAEVVDDPTTMNPGGQMAADLASSKGHKGIVGYLAKMISPIFFQHCQDSVRKHYKKVVWSVGIVEKVIP